MVKSGKARAHTNIALIKYWGKADEDLILPMNNSLSVSLERFYTETKVTFSESYTEDTLVLNGETVNAAESKKITRFMDMLRAKTNTTLYSYIESENFVPTAAGLASSASAYAALASACNEALQLGWSDKELSRFARRGSGSASRSLFGGFVAWEKAYDDTTSYSFPIDADRWEDHVDEDIAAVKEAISRKDFKGLGEVIEANGLRMHATNLGAQPPFTYLVPESYQAMEVVHQCRELGYPCYFTMDAGPNVKILVEKHNQAHVIEQLHQHFEPHQIIASDITRSGVEIIE